MRLNTVVDVLKSLIGDLLTGVFRCFKDEIFSRPCPGDRLCSKRTVGCCTKCHKRDVVFEGISVIPRLAVVTGCFKEAQNPIRVVARTLTNALFTLFNLKGHIDWF